MTGIGHNGGPGIATSGWQRYAWRRAREELLPTLPIEIVRRRVRRARELGIDYKSYASIRAATGRDVIALLFSSNALKVGPKVVAIPETEATRLATLTRTTRLAATHLPLAPTRLLAANPGLLDRADTAPTLAQGWSETREVLHRMTGAEGLPSDAVVVVGETMLEQEWAVAGRMAGYLDAHRYFTAT